ncbi:hypothetical protein OS493_012338 [Desmophyllum pertusum]|uniref:Uncharacterized protein n=1 Tax=Desmophyllum pertusum TaxID=174260 RepID=A0A9W9ZRA0_9CNID|nr:hypothetical protein OS493_012338 [Desmophyllum pertusum]
MKEEITNTKKELEKEIEKRRRKEQENKEMKRKMNEGNGTGSGEAGSKMKSLLFTIQNYRRRTTEKRVKESKKADKTTDER